MNQLYKPLFFVLAMAALAITTQAQTVHYVNPGAAGANNGTSWTNAFTNLDAALAAAASGHEIWVAQGTYVPSKDITGNNTPADNRTKTFTLKEGIKLYGGFTGTETAITQRIKSNKSILSGDLAGNDGLGFANNEENSYHVLVANSLTTNVTLDGFTIRGGNADNNTTSFLGYIYGHSYGAGLLALGNTGLTLFNVNFQDNKARFYGGAIYNGGTDLFNVESCVFVNNLGGNGSGAINNNCYSADYINIYNCLFYNNTAGSVGGGVMMNNGGTTSIINSTFVNNTSSTNGLVFYNLNGPTVTLKNSIVWGNTGSGSLFRHDSGTMTITDSNIQGGYAGTGNINSDPAFRNESDPDGIDNTWGTADDGLVPHRLSASVNSGNDASLPSAVADLAGNPRTTGQVDMGAYENQNTPAKIYVQAGAAGVNNGSTWSNAFTSLQMALESAISGDEIWVAQGTYVPSADINNDASPADNRTKTFTLKEGVKLYGGFIGTESSIPERIKSNKSILSGDLAGDDGIGFINNDENSYHVLVANSLTTNVTLDGFIIRGGNANNTSTPFLGYSAGHAYGAGLFALACTSLTLYNNDFVDNKARFNAGAIYNKQSSLLNVESCVFVNNVADHGGGAIENDGVNVDNANYFNCLFYNNNTTGVFGGGVMVNNGGNVSIINSTIVNNTSSTDGLVFYNLWNTVVEVKNSIIWGNPGSGSLFKHDSGTLTITDSNIQGGYSGSGNINIDPAFRNASDPDGTDNTWGTSDDGLVLLRNSKSANSGNNASLPSAVSDLAGNARTSGQVDMGAYETPMVPMRIYVNSTASGANDGSTWSNAFTGLQMALETAISGDEIWVAQGTFVPEKDITGNSTPAEARTKTFLLKDGVKMYGGFVGNETSITQRVKSNKTVLSGDLSGDDGVGFINNNENVYHVTVVDVLTTSTLIDGFLIRGGNANVATSFLVGPFGNRNGGGMFVSQASTYLTVDNCTFLNNYGHNGGGGMYVTGISTNKSSVTIKNSVFADNRCDNAYGGAVHFYYNSTSNKIINSVFSGNYSGYQGGAIYNWSANTEIINSTITKNNGYSNGGAIHMRDYSISVKNSIIWGNSSSFGARSISSESGTVTVSYSNIQDGFAGTNNLNEDPLFRNINDGDGIDNIWGTADDGLALKEGTTSADAGNNSYITGTLYDIVGDNRIQNTTVNLGAYETLKLNQTLNFASVLSKYYGDIFTINVTASSGLPVSLSVASGAATISGNEVTITGIGSVFIKATQPGDDTYAYVEQTNYFYVYPRIVRVTPDLNEKIFGESDPVLTFSITEGDVITGDSFTGNILRVSGEDAGTYSVQQGTLDLGPNYNLVFTEADFTINPRPISVNAMAAEKVYGDTDPDFMYTYTGIIESGDDFSGAMSRVAGEDAGFYSLTRGTLTLSDNYEIIFNPADLTILPRSITVTAEDAMKIYGDADPAFTYSLSTSLVGSDTFDGELQRLPSEEIGSYVINQGTLSLNDNYNLSFNSGSLTIDTRSLTVSADAKEKAFGEADPAFTYTITSGSLVGSDEISGSLTREPGETTGSYRILQNNLSAGNNYALTYNENFLNINKVSQSITFVMPDKKFVGDAPFNVTAEATSGLPVTISSNNENVATVNGSTITIVGAGTVRLTATQQGDENYMPAESVVNTLIVEIITANEPELQTLLIYPNPASDFIMVNSKSLISGSTILMHDAFGKQVLSQSLTSANEAELKISLEHLANGVYYLSILKGNDRIVKKIIKK